MPLRNTDNRWFGFHSCNEGGAQGPKAGKYLGMELEYFIRIVNIMSFVHVCKLKRGKVVLG